MDKIEKGRRMTAHLKQKEQNKIRRNKRKEIKQKEIKASKINNKKTNRDIIERQKKGKKNDNTLETKD